MYIKNDMTPLKNYSNLYFFNNNVKNNSCFDAEKNNKLYKDLKNHNDSFVGGQSFSTEVLL